MLEHAIVHVANLLGDESIKLVADAALKPTADVVGRSLRHFLHLRGDKLEELELEVGRLRDTVETFQEELGHVRDAVGPDAVNAESREPAFKDFASQAFSVAATTTLESKRRLAGIMIARRLGVKTDSREDILLRRALSAMQDLTENELLMLAAAHLVIFGPSTDVEHDTFGSRDELEAFLRPRYQHLAQYLYDQLRFDEDDFGTLASVGAARIKDDTGALLLESDSASPLDMWSIQHGVDQYDGLEGEWGTQDSGDAFRRRFPTVILLRRLSEGKSRLTPDNRRHLDDVILTSLGVTIGELVLQQLLSRGADANTA